MKRSSWASGSSNVPLCSIGFWVAITRNGAGSLKRLVADRHPPLLHRFQQGALHLGACAVDLVGQQQVREDRALVDPEIAGPLVEDLRAEDVGGEQVDRELDPGEVQVDRLGEHRDQQASWPAREPLEAAGGRR